MNSDDFDVASLAAMTNGRINQINSKFTQSTVPKVDIRRVIGNQPSQQQYPHPQQYQYPQPQQQPPQFEGGVDEYGLPVAVMANTSQLPMVIRDRDGNIIDLNGAPSASPVSTGYAPSPAGHNYQGFQVPEYGPAKGSNAKKGGHPQEHPFDTILKEIKSLKKSVNKLIRDVESSKLLTATTNPQIINEADSKPTNLP